MTSRTRPPRPNDLPPRDPTQPLSIEVDPDADRDSHPSLAMGTHGDERTKVESPSARNNPVSARERPASKPPPTPQRNDEAEHRLGAVLGTYRLTELLGKGGMGYVYRAEHTKLGREVALKVLRADYARRRDAVNRFFQEAKTVNRVRHRNIVDVTDFVELPDGTTFIIMELLRGQSLGKWARTGIDLPRALAVLVQICDGLGAAHAVGVVHRDLKPDNVVVVPTSDGAELVKLLDFGVAKLVNRDDEDVGFQTQAGSVIGTPAYMSPEQAGGMAVDQRSDIYSLGAIMYELFCGQPLFRGRSFGEYVRKHLTEMPIAPKQTQGGAAMSDALEALILRCLAKEPNDRFGHILELRDGLLHLLGGVETHPGVQQAISQIIPPSGVRPPPTAQLSAQMSAQLPPHMLPLQPPMVTTNPTPHPSGHSSMHPAMQSAMHSSQHSQQLGYSQYSHVAVPKTPLWVWLVGGSLAVGLGIVAAVWYANRGDDAPPKPLALEPQPAKVPDVAPIPQPTTKPAPLELRFDSLPSAGIYADGHSAELCRTPCSFNVDPGDGESATQRTFVVRSEGYRDKSIVVDLTAPQREFHATLERVEAVAQPVEVEAQDPTPDKRRPGGKAGKGKAGKGQGKTTDKTADKTADKTPDKTPDVVAEPDKTKKLDDNSLEKPDPNKKDTNIDPTDTHDPFHHH